MGEKAIQKPPEESDVPLYPDGWNCAVCGISNPDNFLACYACTAERVQSRKTGEAEWRCRQCQETNPMTENTCWNCQRLKWRCNK